MKISDDVIMSGKTDKKSKMPNAITEKVYNENLKISQKGKSDAETQKGAKERKRIEKSDNRKNLSDD